MPPSALDKEKTIIRNSVQNRAIEAGNEQLDDVKLMNKMVAYAKTATIREKQLEEKRRDWEVYKVQEKKKDKLMEIERLKKIQEIEAVEEEKRVEALKGKEVIIEQIKAREIERLKKVEEQEREGQLMVQRMKELQREEERQNEIKRQKQKKMNEEILEVNRNAILITEQRKAKERREDEEIAQYVKEKADQEA